MGFNRQQAPTPTSLDGYVEVAERVRQFYERFPEGSIQTRLMRLEGGLAVFRAAAYRTPEDPRPTTGWAYEKEGTRDVNLTSFIENCETSAIGRALANLNFAARPRPSREEMAKVLAMRATEEQLEHIRSLVESPRITPQVRQRVLRRVRRGLTRQQASEAINYVQALLAETLEPTTSTA